MGWVTTRGDCVHLTSEVDARLERKSGGHVYWTLGPWGPVFTRVFGCPLGYSLSFLGLRGLVERYACWYFHVVAGPGCRVHVDRK